MFKLILCPILLPFAVTCLPGLSNAEHKEAFLKSEVFKYLEKLAMTRIQTTVSCPPAILADLAASLAPSGIEELGKVARPGACNCRLAEEACVRRCYYGYTEAFYASFLDRAGGLVDSRCLAEIKANLRAYLKHSARPCILDGAGCAYFDTEVRRVVSLMMDYAGMLSRV